MSTPRPYRPSNGTEGEIFMDGWCLWCERDRAFREDVGDSCPIAAATMAHDTGDPGYPAEWITDEKGPRCTAFVPEGETVSAAPDPNQLALFPTPTAAEEVS